MPETVKFYYDYKSPFTYLAFAPALELEATHDVRLRVIPHELDVHSAYGGELEQRPERDWFKVRYLYADARRFANDRGLIIRGPQKIFDSRRALIGGLYADRHGRFREYSRRVFERFFKRELDLEDDEALVAVLTEAGLDVNDFRRFADDEGETALRLACEEADRDGVFGVPTLIVAGEMFWGNDRIKWVVKKLDTMGLKRETGVQDKSMRQVPVGAKGTYEFTVKQEQLANTVEPSLPPVLATAMMSLAMELAAIDALKPYLEPGEMSVGVVVNVTHTGATPEGWKVRTEAQVTKSEGRRIEYDLRAYDEKEQIGHGTHARAVLERAKFDQRFAAKVKGT